MLITVLKGTCSTTQDLVGCGWGCIAWVKIAAAKRPVLLSVYASNFSYEYEYFTLGKNHRAT